MARAKPPSRIDFLSPLSVIPGLGDRRVRALKESGITNIGDLLYHFPRRYIDRSVITPIGMLEQKLDQYCTVIGTITKTRLEPGKRKRLRIQITDESGSFEALWFHGVSFFRKTLSTGKRLLLYGKVGKYVTYQMVHPLVESIGSDKHAAEVPYLPQYPLSTAMRDVTLHQKLLFKSIQWILKHIKHYPQKLPKSIEQKKQYPPLAECLAQIHVPQNLEKLHNYYARLKYEELYQLALTLRWSRRKFALPGRSLLHGGFLERFKKILPFTLSPSQNDAIETLFADSASSQRMHRMLQGDVGSGKTVVAFAACLPALHEGCQVTWLAPTEILARQTYETVLEWLNHYNIKAKLFIGGMAHKERSELLKELQSGDLPFIIGTHALLQPTVNFARLGMTVIDEQHKFGAQQRLSLQQKGPAADFLLMSATPIPQTLAQTLYGDLDIVTIKGRPGRGKAVNTHLVPEKKRTDMETFMLKEIEQGGSQVFYLVPRIDSENEKMVLKDVHSVYETLHSGRFSHIPLAPLHGKQTSQEKERIMSEFARGDLKMLIATTVVEVGIDVSNATIMVIENAERFGLSQLHQLRGRVGRGEKESYAFLLTNDNPGDLAMKRLKKFCQIHDGFHLADLDLKMRGPGEVVGFRQSGWDELSIANILDDAPLFREIQEDLKTILQNEE